ncbi:MAG TPA: DUF2071 domain-containing protein [Gemmataceae bacterium]|nr:DUF2071 domain-containing protein [Gemmataceae bacterium]
MAHRPKCEPDNEPDAMPSWVWSQEWLNVLFLHWPVPVATLRSHVPAPVEIATYQGAAWVSLVLFRLRVRPRWLPFLPGVSELVEVNLRTYVHFRDRAGIWFLSVHADNRWAIRLARLLTPMPYLRATMRYRRAGDRFRFEAERASAPGLGLALTFVPIPGCVAAAGGTLDAWLLERYRLFVPGRRRAVAQAEVAHPPWVTQGVEVCVSANRLGSPFGLDLARPPERAHYSAGVRARFGAFRGPEGLGPDDLRQPTAADLAAEPGR